MEDKSQKKSWSNFHGSTKYQGLIAQIYFPFDGDRLDDNDRAALDRLLDQYRILLLGRRITFHFIGNADHRGSDKYNIALGARRAKAVKEYFDKALRFFPKYYSSTLESVGERYAGMSDHAGDRRVDVFSSFVPKRPPIAMPPIAITGTVPRTLVRRPVQYVDIFHMSMRSDGPHDSDIRGLHTIILEKHEMIDQALSFPCDNHVVDTTMHKKQGVLAFFSPVQVSRNRFRWRKPLPSDTMKNVAAGLLNILAGILDSSGGYDLGEGIPELGGKVTPNQLPVFESWDKFLAKDPANSEFAKYKSDFWTR